MRFDEQIHWGEGLFLQQHHMQRMQRLLADLSRKQRQLLMSFAYGFCDLELDLDALKSRRVVVKRMSAIMPDGQELSMPGNCSVPPLTLNFEDTNGNDVMIYVRLPRWSDVEPNLATQAGRGGRFLLRETSAKDENSSDDEIPVMVRTLNVSLTADPADIDNFTLLPLCRVNWAVINSSQPSLRLDDSYMPPFITVSNDCPLFGLCSELLFQLRSAKNTIISALSSDGYDPATVSPRHIAKLLKLKSLSRFVNRLGSELIPENLTPYELYLELVDLLGELQALEPFGNNQDPAAYEHNNSLPEFRMVLKLIRDILLQGGVSSALSFNFIQPEGRSYLELSINDERVFAAREIFLALSFGGDLVTRIKDIEGGDKFRLLDRESIVDRVRGVKLVRLRYPPQYLPSLTNTLWFRVMSDESERIWSLISEEKNMVIDCVHDLFPNLKATLYVSIEDKSDQK